MKRIDYFWPRAIAKITGIVFFTQLIVEIAGIRKPGFEWVLPVCAALFSASYFWALCAVVLNALWAKD